MKTLQQREDLVNEVEVADRQMVRGIIARNIMILTPFPCHEKRYFCILD